MQVLAPVGMRAAALPRRAKTSTVSQRSVVVSAGPQEEIYIGFVKEEGFGSREGKKGRVIKDDPRKYPSRDEYGTGGWAGGEVGLWELRDAVKSDKKAGSKKPVAAVGPSSPLVPRAPAGKAPIYVGFGKDELELRKSGVKGRIVVDDPRKYPNKEDIGPLSGVAGGFAGGEKGVKQFVATGDIKLRKPGEPGPRQFSPLTLAGVVALGGFGAAALLSQFGDAGETSALPSRVLQVSLDSQTKYAILAALGLVSVSGLLIALNTAARSVSEALENSAEKVKEVAVSGAFVLVVLAIARSILSDI